MRAPRRIVGKVQYVDYTSEFVPEDNLFARVMHKRKSFEHEREVRAIVAQDPVGDPPVGLLVPIEIRRLVTEVRVAPTAPDWFRAVVDEISERMSVDLKSGRSDLDRDPIW